MTPFWPSKSASFRHFGWSVSGLAVLRNLKTMVRVAESGRIERERAVPVEPRLTGATVEHQ